MACGRELILYGRFGSGEVSPVCSSNLFKNLFLKSPTNLCRCRDIFAHRPLHSSPNYPDLSG